jgi:hypothetical protein
MNNILGKIQSVVIEFSLPVALGVLLGDLILTSPF